MNGRRLRLLEQVLSHALLLGVGLVFMLPFLWMVSTSMKVPREMVRDNLRFLPRAPTPQWNTPYLDVGEFDPPSRASGVPPVVWAAAYPDLEALVEERITAWSPATPGPEGNPSPATVPADQLHEAMRNGLFNFLDRRIRDEARGAAQRFHEETAPEGTSLTADSPAVRIGVEALMVEADRLINEESLREVFNEAYRRICFGATRVRTRDFGVFALHSGDEWEVLSGDAELVTRHDNTPDVQEARIRFDADGPPVRFGLIPEDPLQFDPAMADRLYIGYRADASWAQASFEVISAGRLYRAEGAVSLFERQWVEQELRWPDAITNPLARRLHLTLQDMGPAPEGSPEFAAIVELRRISPLRAWWAKGIHNYWQSFREVPYARYLATSFSLAILNIVLAIFSCTLVAYGFARLEWPGRDLCFVLLLATMMLPPQVTMVPSFLIVRWLGWYDTLIPLWILSAFGVPFFIFLLRQFFKTIPMDLEDAARIDGCGFLAIYWHVMLPLVKPVIATIAIFTFMASWNNFMGPLIYVNDDRLFPLAMGLFRFNLLIESIGGNIGLIMAASFMMVLPVILLFFFLQRYFVQGITLTGTKE